MSLSKLRALLRLRKADETLDLLSQHLDREFYLQSYPDVAASSMNPVQHYLEYGHDQDRDPSPSFSTAGYKARYPDVAAAGMNAYFHYLKFGQYENRETGPASSYFGVAPEELSYFDVAPMDVALEPQLGLVRERELLRIADALPGLDLERVGRLLGIAADGLQPRPWRVGMTSVLRQSSGGHEVDREAAERWASESAEQEALADSLVAAARGKVLSLDLWDTILRRHCAPDSVKLRHARAQWLTRLPLDSPYSALHPVDLLQMRRMAEAHVADEHFEYRLKDVASWLEPLLSRPGEDFAAAFLEQELRIERSAITVDPIIADVMERHEGRKVVISDFYMPGTALEDLISHAGITGIDRVYSSSDHLATKRAGTLYDVVLEQEGLASASVLHVGDRYTSDVISARKRGIEAEHYLPASVQPTLEQWDRDFWCHVAGDSEAIARALARHLGCYPQEEPGLEGLGASVCGFVLQVMEEALRRNVDTVHFMTREGVFFRRIYDMLVEIDVFDVGKYPESALIEVSRRSTFAASLSDFAIEPLRRLWSQYSVQSISALAITLNIDLAEWRPVAKQLGIDVDKQIEYPWRDQDFRRFITHPRIVRTGRQAIARQCSELVEYLEAAGFEPRADKDRLVVDIGWRGTIQDNLAQLVAGRIHGCYFGLERFLNPQPANGSKSAYVFDVERGYPLHISEVAGLEFLFNAPGGSTAGYRAGKAIRQIIPKEEDCVLGPVAALQARLLEGAARTGDFVKRHGLVSHDFVSFAREIVERFTRCPPVEVAEAFFGLSHNESFGTGEVHSMKFDASALDLASLGGARLHGRVSEALGSVRWSAAAVQLQDYRQATQDLTQTQQLSLPTAAAIVHPGRLGQPKVAVLSPPPIRGSGGHRTIFNFAAALARTGFEVHLMHEQPADAETQAWIGSVIQNAPIVQHNNWINWIEPAASIATIWYSNDFPKQFWQNETRNFYFVQDYEAMFNPMGDTFLRATQSYAGGSSHICVGHWLAHVLRSEFGVGVAPGGLGVDHTVYRPLADVERLPNRIALLFQPEKYRRAPELCSAALQIVKRQRPDADIVIYGSDQRPHLPFAFEHRGLITDVHEINRLYNSAAVGLCVSATNPSRIPFEMMAAGCVPVDIYRYNNLFDYESGCGVLAHESPESMAMALLMLLDDEAARRKRSEACRESAKHRSLTWEMDAAVNAVRFGLEGGNFDLLDPPAASYHDRPIIAPAVDTQSARHFLEHQWRLATSLSPTG